MKALLTAAPFLMLALALGAAHAQLFPIRGNGVAGAVPTAAFTFSPPSPVRISDTTRGVVTQYSVTMSDGSAFAGKVAFGPPNMDAGGIFALAGSGASGNIIVNPAGPGLGPVASTVTDHITLQATP